MVPVLKLRKKKKSEDGDSSSYDEKESEEWELSPEQNELSASPPLLQSISRDEEDTPMEHSSSFLEDHSKPYLSMPELQSPFSPHSSNSSSDFKTPELQIALDDLNNEFDEPLNPDICPNVSECGLGQDDSDMAMMVEEKKEELELTVTAICIPDENLSHNLEDWEDILQAAKTLINFKSNNNSPQPQVSPRTPNPSPASLSEVQSPEREIFEISASVPEIYPNDQPSQNEDNENFELCAFKPQTPEVLQLDLLQQPPEKNIWQPWTDDQQRTTTNFNVQPAKININQHERSNFHLKQSTENPSNFNNLRPLNLSKQNATSSVSPPSTSNISLSTSPPNYFRDPKQTYQINSCPVFLNIPQISNEQEIPSETPLDMSPGRDDRETLVSLTAQLSLSSQPTSNFNEFNLPLPLLENSIKFPTAPLPPANQSSSSQSLAGRTQSSPSLLATLPSCDVSVQPSRGKRKKSNNNSQVSKRFKTNPRLGSTTLGAETVSSVPSSNNAVVTPIPSGGDSVQRDGAPPPESCEELWQARLTMYSKLTETFGIDDVVALNTLREMFKPALDMYDSKPETLQTWLSLMYSSFTFPSSTSKFISLVLKPIIFTLRSEKKEDIILMIFKHLEIKLKSLIETSNPNYLHTLRDKIMSLEFMEDYEGLWNMLQLIRIKNIEVNQSHPITLIALCKIACMLYITKNYVKPLENALYFIKKEMVNGNFNSNIVIISSILEYFLLIDKLEIVLMLLEMLLIKVKSKPGEFFMNEIQIVLSVKVYILISLGKYDEVFKIYIAIYEIFKFQNKDVSFVLNAMLKTSHLQIMKGNFNEWNQWVYILNERFHDSRFEFESTLKILNDSIDLLNKFDDMKFLVGVLDSWKLNLIRQKGQQITRRDLVKR